MEKDLASEVAANAVYQDKINTLFSVRTKPNYHSVCFRPCILYREDVIVEY